MPLFQSKVRGHFTMVEMPDSTGLWHINLIIPDIRLFIHYLLFKLYSSSSYYTAGMLLNAGVEVNNVNTVCTLMKPQVHQGRQVVNKSCPHAPIDWEAAQLPRLPLSHGLDFLPLHSNFAKAFPTLLFTPFTLESTCTAHRQF